MDSLSCRYLVSRVPGRRAGRVVASCPAWLGSTTKRRSFVERVPEKSVFAELVAADRSAVWAVRLRITGNRADAEDALQDTLLAVWRKLAQFRSDAEFSYGSSVSRRTRRWPLFVGGPKLRKSGPCRGICRLQPIRDRYRRRCRGDGVTVH